MGVELFYFILTLINEESNAYPPTRQFFTQCLERLGQVSDFNYFFCDLLILLSSFNVLYFNSKSKRFKNEGSVFKNRPYFSIVPRINVGSNLTFVFF